MQPIQPQANHSSQSQSPSQAQSQLSKQSQPQSYQRHGRTTAISDHANLQVLKRIRRYLLTKDFVIHDELLQQMVAGYDIADPVTDRLITKGFHFAKPLQQAILHDQLPSSLQQHSTEQADFLALVEQFSCHPDWYDPSLAEIGAKAYRRYPLMLIWLLRNVALMAGYSIPALSLPLIQTGALTHDALPRLMRTYAYILAVSEYPAIRQHQYPTKPQQWADTVLAIGQEGWRQSIKVRQIHTIVRQALLTGKIPASKQGLTSNANHTDQHWDSNYWGIPINQTDMVATHLQFSLLIMRGLRLLGARISEEEAQGILHLWNMASYWMGVDLHRLPKDENLAWEWIYTYLSIQQLDFTMGKPLAKALHDLPSQIMGEENRKGQFVELVNASVTRTLVGDDIADGLALPKPKWRLGILTSVPILFGLDSLRQHHRWTAKKLEKFRQQRQDNMNWWLKEHDAYYRSKPQ